MQATDTKPIAVIQGTPSATVQAIFRDLVERWRPTLRIAGVIEESHGLADRKCSAGYLRNIRTGELYPIFQDLGSGAEACHLDGQGALSAAGMIEHDIAAGCDLVLFSKFGKLETAGGGLREAFTTAMAASVPILTSVSPAFEADWRGFAAPLFVMLPPDVEEIEAWRRAVSAKR